jgi:Alkylmercury lyase
VILERDGATIRGAYPFTQSATGHSLTFVRRERTLNTMCAIDALGAGAMCREDTMIRSGCHLCGVPVIVETRNRGMVLDESVGDRPSCGRVSVRPAAGRQTPSALHSSSSAPTDTSICGAHQAKPTMDAGCPSKKPFRSASRSLPTARCWAAAETGVPCRITGEHQTGHHARLGLSIRTMRTSFMSIGVASNIRTCAARSSVWRQSIARPQS